MSKVSEGSNMCPYKTLIKLFNARIKGVERENLGMQ
jgi:hypothetical protein